MNKKKRIEKRTKIGNDAMEKKLFFKKEMEKKRVCAAPLCRKQFSWEKKKKGQKYCSPQCVLMDPERLVGRKGVINDEIKGKLRMAFMVGATDQEACEYAGISTSTLMDYQKKFPEFKEEKMALKNTRVMKARIKVFNDIDNDGETAKWTLERLRKNEYGAKTFFQGDVFNGEIDEKHRAIARKLLAKMDKEEDQD